MGALVTKALRPIKSFNIENRAHRVIAKDKPDAAPKYPQNYEDIKRALQADPDLNEKLDNKNTQLDVRLKDVYVTSHGIPEDDITRQIQKQNPNRPLPQDRKQFEDFEYGYKEPVRIPYGRTTLKNVITFIQAHQINPEEVTAAKIALEYKLKEEDVANILKIFKTFEVYIPDTKKTKATFAGPATLRRELSQNILKEISATNLETVMTTRIGKYGIKKPEKLEEKNENKVV